MKTWIDLNAQVQKHMDRGLDLESMPRDRFAMFLYSSNYYRVSGYARCFYARDAERYVTGTTAAKLMEVYDLDRAVRNLVLDGIGVVEPTLRSRVAYHVSKTLGGSDGYRARDFYLPVDPSPEDSDEPGRRRAAEEHNRDKVLQDFESVQNRPEIFIQHHLKKGEPVPFWAAIEVVSIGTFSRFLKALRDKTVLEPVVASLALEDRQKFLQAVHNLAFLRNIAAHHGRLWHRQFDGYVTLPEVALRVKRQYLAPNTPAAALTLLAGLVDQIESSTSYSTALLDLVHSDSELAAGYYYPRL